MKYILPISAILLLVALFFSYRPSPRPGDIWRYHDATDMDAQVISIDADQVSFKDLTTGDTLLTTVASFMGGSEKVGEVKPIEHKASPDTAINFGQGFHVCTDSAKPAPDLMLKITRYLEIMSRCRDLENEVYKIEILYAGDKATYEEVEKAQKRYKKYYFTIYKPALDSLKINK